MVARHQTAAHNQRVGFATADACHLPFRDGVFDSTFCVAVLQHIGDVDAAVGEFARVTTAGGRVLAVEPDNRARYSYSATPAGVKAFEMSTRFFAALAAARGRRDRRGRRSAAPGALRAPRNRAARRQAVSGVADPPGCAARRRLDAPARGRRAGDRSRRRPTRSGRSVASISRCSPRTPPKRASAGPGFVEIQNTMLFATVGQKTE